MVGGAVFVGRLLLQAAVGSRMAVDLLVLPFWIGGLLGLTVYGFAMTVYLLPADHSYIWKHGVWFSRPGEFKRWRSVLILRNESGRITGLAHSGWWSREAGRFDVPEELAPRVEALLPAVNSTPASAAPTA